MTKIKGLLNERFKAIATLGEKLQAETASNTEIEKQIEALTEKNNILNMETLIKNGLLLLKEEGWLSEDDYQTISTTDNTESSP
jgi:regulator of replication initiation timing